MSEAILGIDLGTTNSCGWEYQHGIILNKLGGRTTPSVVAYSKNGEITVGSSAKNQALMNTEGTILESKRVIGAQFDDKKIQALIKSNTLPYKLVRGKNGEALIEVHGKTVSPIEVGAQVLRHIKECAESALGKTVTKAVITVPAYFDDAQRQATKDAGRIAGLEVLRIINEPTAAALAYGMQKKGADVNVIVYDLGGGTFDVSVISIARVEGDNQFEVRATSGDTFLGGGDFDHRVIQYLISEFQKEQGIDLQQDKMALQRLKEAAEKAKIELSSSIETDINLPFITANQSGPKHLLIKLTRAKLEELTGDLIDRTMQPCETALKSAGLTIQDIDEVILVGGQTRMPRVQEVVEKFFGKKPRHDVNPDEAVAYGAAVQGGVLSGNVKDVLLLDVTPLALGIETLGGLMSTMVPANTTIPVKRKETFSTATDNQTAVTLNVLQGNYKEAAKNRSLGRFDLIDIPSAPRGLPQIEVAFDIDANGILKVSAVDKATGKAQSIEIKNSGSLSEEEIESMKKGAEANAEKERQFEELVHTRNSADAMSYATTKAMKEVESKLSSEDKTQIEKIVTELKDLIKGEDKAAIETKMQELRIYQEKCQSLQAQSGSSDSGGSASESQTDQNTSASEDVVDAEFEEVKSEQDKN